jgi:hypothetical protein
MLLRSMLNATETDTHGAKTPTVQTRSFALSPRWFSRLLRFPPEAHARATSKQLRKRINSQV